jgi:D-proline reductase (dithiol) PrdB
VPVLARTFEEAGMSTVLVTLMPFWAERLGVPRTVGVEFPYGHLLGQPGDRDTQMGIIREALKMLEEATEPGEIRELDYVWPQDLDEAKRDWQPTEPSPIIKMMLERRRAAQQGGS